MKVKTEVKAGPLTVIKKDGQGNFLKLVPNHFIKGGSLMKVKTEVKAGPVEIPPRIGPNK